MSQKPGEKWLDNKTYMAVASTETGLASTVKKDEGASQPPKIDPVASSVNPIPAPTPPPDIVEDLCTKAAREVEALRIKDAASTQYIGTIEKQAVVLKDINSSQNDYIAEQKKIITDYKEMRKNDAEIHQNDLKEIANLKKEVEILKAKKCGLVCQGLRILTGIGIGAIFL